MIPHKLKIGQRIFDTYDNRWGTIFLINNEEKDMVVREDDTIITYTPDGEEYGSCETYARDAYPLVENRYWFNEEVCLEILKDEFDEEHNYDFYCPSSDENCWEVECVTDKK